MTSPINGLIRGTADTAQADPEGTALVEAARAARFHNPAVVLDLVAADARQDPTAAVQALIKANPGLVRRTDAGAGEGRGADPLAAPQGQHPFSLRIRRHAQGG